jgi:hypothetical protein
MWRRAQGGSVSYLARRDASMAGDTGHAVELENLGMRQSAMAPSCARARSRESCRRR